MVELKIDGRAVAVAEQTTLLEAARELGVEIPTMCHLDGYEHFTSCMLCIVEDRRDGRLLPACSTLVADGMDVATGSERVLAGRKSALELLLSEHVGDCDAPCQIVCKAGIDIPLMIRKIAAGEIDAAATAVKTAVPDSADPCAECGGRCEKACRRRRHDEAVAIRRLIKFAIDHGRAQAATAADGQGMDFNCNMGRIRPEEMEVFLDAASEAGRVEAAEGGYRMKQAVEEARRCLHCDCRKRLDCRLRRYADEYGARQRHYAFAERKPFRQVRQQAGIVYEPGKCIKCGICVRITARRKEELGLAFIGRGFDVEVGVPFDEALGKALRKSAAECVEKCPTAALAMEDA